MSKVSLTHSSYPTKSQLIASSDFSHESSQYSTAFIVKHWRVRDIRTPAKSCNMNMVSMSPQCKFNSETPKGFIFSRFGGSLQLSRFFHTLRNTGKLIVYRTQTHNGFPETTGKKPRTVTYTGHCCCWHCAWSRCWPHGHHRIHVTSVRDFLFRVGASLYNLRFGVYTLNEQPQFSRPLKNSSNTFGLQSEYNDLQFKNWIHRSCFVLLLLLF